MFICVLVPQYVVQERLTLDSERASDLAAISVWDGVPGVPLSATTQAGGLSDFASQKVTTFFCGKVRTRVPHLVGSKTYCASACTLLAREHHASGGPSIVIRDVQDFLGCLMTRVEAGYEIHRVNIVDVYCKRNADNQWEKQGRSHNPVTPFPNRIQPISDPMAKLRRATTMAPGQEEQCNAKSPAHHRREGEHRLRRQFAYLSVRGSDGSQHERAEKNRQESAAAGDNIDGATNDLSLLPHHPTTFSLFSQVRPAT
jgi:hypothetical protein